MPSNTVEHPLSERDESHCSREIFKKMRADYVFYNKSNIELGLRNHAKLLTKEWIFGLDGYTKGLVKTFWGC